jgi:hypothetical protein
MRRIRKVKLTKEEKIMIVFEQMAGGDWDEYSLTCSEKALPSFYQAVQDLVPHVIEMCELPADYAERIIVRGVSVSYGGEAEVMGATITAQMTLMKSNCPLNLNTPHKASDSYSESDADPNQLLSDNCIAALKALYRECERYIDGERAQGKLFPAA